AAGLPRTDRQGSRGTGAHSLRWRGPQRHDHAVRLLRALLVVTIILCLPAGAARAADGGGLLGEGDAYATELLAQLRSAYRGLDQERRDGNELSLRIQFDLAISSLVALHELYGMDWARERLSALMHE